MTDLLRRAERLAGLDRVVRRVELRLARRDHERRRGPVPGVDARSFAPLADAVHAALDPTDQVSAKLKNRLHNATMDVGGVSPQHEAEVEFATRQLLDVLTVEFSGNQS